MNERIRGRDINGQTDRIFKFDSVNSFFISAKLFSHAGVPGENRLRLQQACSSFRDLQQPVAGLYSITRLQEACSTPAD